MSVEIELLQPETSVIGPQIGPSFDPCGVRIAVGFPGKNLGNLTCVMKDEGNKEHSSGSVEPKDQAFANYLFPFSGLNQGEKYFYRFLDQKGNVVDLEGLNESDCWFYGPSFNHIEDRFVLMSCNNPFHAGDDCEEPFGMWDRLLERVNTDPHIKLIAQGGDQVYNDDLEKKCLKLLKADTEDTEGVVRSIIIENYQRYLGNLSIRRILAHIPSIAMLDDHDITDGWGGRKESFIKDTQDFHPEWKAFFDITYAAFQAYQTPKNPEIRIHGYKAETTYLDFGVNRLYMLDLRSEKNVQNDDRPLISEEHENGILRSLDHLPASINNIFVLSPVVPVRVDLTLEERIGWIFKIILWIKRFLKKQAEKKPPGKHTKLCAKIYKTMNKNIPDLSDDMEDGLSSNKNRKFLKKLLRKLAESVNGLNKKGVLLSGDIHVGGISEIFVKSENSVITIPQIVSSPIGYEPMPKIVKDFTTEEKVITIEDTPGISAINVFYRSDRNFAIIKPHKLDHLDAIEFIFDSLPYPQTFPAYFSNTGDKKAAKN